MAHVIGIDGERLLDELETLATFGSRAGEGIDRPAFSPAWCEASLWLTARMREAGMAVHIDPAGNVIGRLGQANEPAVLCGSHIDTVPGGGALDGALGVIAGIACARALRDADVSIARAFEVVACADEEGAYLSLLGSRAMIGDLDPQEIRDARGRAGDSLVDAMAQAGLDSDRIGDAARPDGTLAAFIELHIEQGPVLEQEGCPIGVVEAIVGLDTVEYRFRGCAAHAGTTPVAQRQDAVRAACWAVTSAFGGLQQRASDTARMTFGALEVGPGASNVVPDDARVVSEVRDISAEAIAELRQNIDKAFTQAAEAEAMRLERRRVAVDAPACMDAAMIEAIRNACAAIGRSSRLMISGAGHDAQVFARRMPTGMIFVPSRRGISHHPDEFTDRAAIVAGAEVLLRTLLSTGLLGTTVTA